MFITKIEGEKVTVRDGAILRDVLKPVYCIGKKSERQAIMELASGNECSRKGIVITWNHTHEVDATDYLERIFESATAEGRVK